MIRLEPFQIKYLLPFVIIIFFFAPIDFLKSQSLSEGFEGTFPPSGWTIINSSCSSNNICQTNYTKKTGTYSLRFSSWNSCAGYNQYLITPAVNTTSGDQTVSFWYRAYSTTYGEKFRVGWSSTGTNVNTDFTWTSDITCSTYNWAQYTKNDLPVGTKYICLWYKSSYCEYLYVDDFTGPSTCTPPSDPSGTITAAANPACNSTTLHYSSPGANIYWQTSATGTSTAYPTTSDYTLNATSTIYVRSYNGSCWSGSTVNSGSVTIYPASVAGTPSGTTTICSGNTTVLTLSGYTGNIQWQQSADGSGGWANVSGGSGATSASYTTAALTSTTYYRAKVTSGVCSVVYSSVLTVTVPSTTTVSAFPFTENFETGSPLPCGWTSTGAGTAHWVQNTFVGKGWSLGGSDPPLTLDGIPTPATVVNTPGAISGTHCLWLDADLTGPSGSTEYLTTPVFDFTAITSAGGRPNLRFYYECYGDLYPELSIQASTDGGATWGTDWPVSNYNRLFANSGAFGGSAGPWWRMVAVPIPAPYSTGNNVKIRICAKSGLDKAHDLWIDDFVVEDIGCSFDCVPAGTLPSGWTTSGSGWANELYDGVAHGNSFWPASAPNLMVTSNAGAIWLFSPGMNLSAGVSYSFNFFYGTDYGSVCDLEVYFGTSAAAGSMTTNIFSDASIIGDLASFRMGTVTFTPATTATYYIGWQAKSISGGGNLYLDNLGIDELVSLPIELYNLTAECENSKISLNWATTSETNNDYFTIERSSDSKYYEIVATIPGAGNSNDLLEYSYYDETVSSGNIYYKLKQTDYDGKFEYFGPVVVNCDNINDEESEISIYPNPATSECFIDLKNLKNAELSIRIMNAVGQTVFNKNVLPKTDQETSAIHVSDIPRGIYFVQVKSDDNSVNKSVKIVKQ